MKNLKILTVFLFLAITVFSVEPPGNEGGGNGDRITAWFASLGKTIVDEINFSYQRGEKILGTEEFRPKRLSAALKTPIILLNEDNLERLKNDRKEIKDLRVTLEKEVYTIYLREKVWTDLYDKKRPEYRSVMHAYLYAAGYNDRDYAVSSQVAEEFFEGLPGHPSPQSKLVPAAKTTGVRLGGNYTLIRFTEDGGLIGIQNNENVFPDRERDQNNPIKLAPHGQHASSYVVRMVARPIPGSENTKLNDLKKLVTAWAYLPRGAREENYIHFNDIVLTKDDGYLIIGCSAQSMANEMGGKRCESGLAIKLNSFGRRQWIAYYPKEVDIKRARELEDGRFLMISEKSIFATRSKGNILNEPPVIPLEKTLISDIGDIEGGDWIVTGMREDKSEYQHPYVLRLTASLKVVWEKEYSNLYGGFLSLAKLSKNSFYVGGAVGKSTHSMQYESFSPFINRINVENGELLWSLKFHEYKGSADNDTPAGSVLQLVPWDEDKVVAISISASDSSGAKWKLPFICPQSLDDILFQTVPYGYRKLEGSKSIWYTRFDKEGKIDASAENHQQNAIPLFATPLKNFLVVSFRGWETLTMKFPESKQFGSNSFRERMIPLRW